MIYRSSTIRCTFFEKGSSPSKNILKLSLFFQVVFVNQILAKLLANNVPEIDHILRICYDLSSARDVNYVHTSTIVYLFSRSSTRRCHFFFLRQRCPSPGSLTAIISILFHVVVNYLFNTHLHICLICMTVSKKHLQGWYCRSPA